MKITTDPVQCAVCEALITHELDSLHGIDDALYEYGLEDETSPAQKLLVLKMLPLTVIGQCVSWGATDSGVRDEIAEFISDNHEAILELIKSV